MNNSKLTVTTLTALALALSSQLHAESDRSIYGGAKYGSYSFELKGTTSMDDSDGYAFVGGMELQNGLAVEVEYGDSGKADFTYGVGAIESGKLRVRNLAGYAVYRTEGNVYAKVKGGITFNMVDATDIRCTGSLCINTISDDQGGLSLGIGAGFAFAERFRTELEYTIIDQEIDLFNLGLLVNF